MSENEETLLTIKEVCDILKLKPQAVRNLYKKHGMPVVQLASNSIRFKKSEIDKYIRSRSVIYKNEGQ